VAEEGPALQKKAYGSGMPPTTSSTDWPILKELRPRLLRQVQVWKRRSGMARNRSVEEILDHCLGILWLDLSAHDEPRLHAPKALRRALYQEFEKPARLQCLPLLAEHPTYPLGGKPDCASEWDEPWQSDWLSQLLEKPNQLRELRIQFSWTRRQLKVHLTAWLLMTFGDSFFQDLTRRLARLATRSAQEGPTQKVRLEARLLHRFTGQLDLPPQWKETRRWLRTLARQKAPGRPENQESASE